MSCYNFLYPITITEGGTFDQRFRWRTGDPLTPVDLTGFTSLTQVRVKPADEAPLIELPHKDSTWEADGETGFYLDEDPETGIYRLYINDEDTIGLCSAHKDITGIYNAFMYSPAGEAVFRQYGPVTILAAAARKAVTP